LQPDSEIEDRAYPMDEVRKKIVTLASTIRKWNDETIKVRKTVKKHLEEILELGLNKYKMERGELRNLINEVFEIYGVNSSWIRKLLPIELKDISKTRISYLQRKEIEKERQRLLQGATESHRTRKSNVYRCHDNFTAEEYPGDQQSGQELKLEGALSLSPEIRKELGTEYTQNSLDHEIMSSSEDLTRIAQQLNEAKRSIERLEEEVRWLSKPFVVKAYLQAADQDIPLIAQIDPAKKVILSIQIDESYSI
jgi:hypothetical protein